MNKKHFYAEQAKWRKNDKQYFELWEREANGWESEHWGIGLGGCQHVTHDRYISVIRNDQLHDYSTNDLQFYFNVV